MAPSTVFARAALRPLSAPSSQLVLSSASSSSAAATRRLTTACRPIVARAPTAAAARAPRAFSSFSSPSASILAATFRRTAHRAGAKGGRRYQSSSAGAGAGAEAGADAGAKPSIFKRLWDSPIGIRTVHFWAPVLKWALVLAGISDLARPAEKLSLTQNAALTATGVIWTRWCLIIKPKNYMLAAVNFFLGIVGIVQCSRIFLYRQSVKGVEGVEGAVPTETAAVPAEK